MYTYFKVRNFRCFQELEFDDLELVNLIAGVNNVGKTALLEAIILHCSPYNPVVTVWLNMIRDVRATDLTPWDWGQHHLSSFFNQFDVSKDIELVGEDTVTGHRSLRLRTAGDSSEAAEANQGNVSVLGESAIGHMRDEPEGILSSSEVPEVFELEYEEPGKRGSHRMIIDRKGYRAEPLPQAPPFPSFFQADRVRTPPTEQARYYGNLELQGKQDRILRALQIIEPRLKSIRTVAVTGGPMLHGDIGIGRLVPLPVMGGGMIRLANLALYIGNAPNGVVLVDEIENGFHHSVMFEVWKAIALAARQSNTQVFATTHSWECIKAAHEAFASEEIYDFRLHRLDRIKGRISAVTYKQGTLASALKHELEVR